MGITLLAEERTYELQQASQKLRKQESEMEYLDFSNKD